LGIIGFWLIVVLGTEGDKNHINSVHYSFAFFKKKLLSAWDRKDCSGQTAPLNLLIPSQISAINQTLIFNNFLYYFNVCSR
jgi:hypothetical protein